MASRGHVLRLAIVLEEDGDGDQASLALVANTREG
jgi:hypothetical protein